MHGSRTPSKGDYPWPLRLDDAQASLHLRRARRRANRARAQLRHCMGRRRLADDAFHAVARARKGRRAQTPDRRGVDDHVRQLPLEASLALRGPSAARSHRLRKARDRRQVPGFAEPAELIGANARGSSSSTKAHARTTLLPAGWLDGRMLANSIASLVY